MRIAIIGGGPAGYEAALVAAGLGATVTLIDRDGLGGACVLWDCVPSKALASTAETLGGLGLTSAMGVTIDAKPLVHAPTMFQRIQNLAAAQSKDVTRKVEQAGVRIIAATATFTGPYELETDTGEKVGFDVALIATGSRPRELEAAKPDGQRILTARHVYDLASIPEKLIVVGSGATGAEFACAFNRLGSQVTLVSSRDRVLPGEDADAAHVLEDVFLKRGIEILKQARATSASATSSGVEVLLASGETISGSHALFTIGQIPNVESLGLEAAGVVLGERATLDVDGMGRTNVRHIYAAGDVTGGIMLASSAAMQGRIAIWHAMGEAVSPLRADAIAATVFTDPEIATVGISEATANERGLSVERILQPLSTNARAKMAGVTDGFVKVICMPGSGTVIGGTIVAPHASDLVLSLSLAVHAQLNVAQVAQAFSIYPSLGGSIQEAARRLMGR
jgi:NAD(P)H dehydrogenase (quinone)